MHGVGRGEVAPCEAFAAEEQCRDERCRSTAALIPLLMLFRIYCFLLAAVRILTLVSLFFFILIRGLVRGHFVEHTKHFHSISQRSDARSLNRRQ